MPTNYIPDGYNHIIPYFIVDNATAFIAFLKSVFGAEEVMRHMRDETSIMHAELRIVDSIIMLSDAREDIPAIVANMFVYVPDADVTFDTAIANGAVAIATMDDKPYGRSGGFADPFGNIWWITTNKLA
jgi:PhnB protein